MKQYQTVAFFNGTIGLVVEADTEEEARAKAEDVIEKMDDDDFMGVLGLQLVEITAEELEKKAPEGLKEV